MTPQKALNQTMLKKKNQKLLGIKRVSGKQLQGVNNFHSFGTGIRTEKKIPNYPGPAHGYKVK
jgi:hypothetical protein